MKELEMKVSPTFTKNYNALYDDSIEVIVNQGGSRSGKTYAILQLLVLDCITNPGRTADVVRDSSNALGQIQDDLIGILIGMGLYDEKLHNKTTRTLNFSNGSRIKLYSTGVEHKLRGMKRDIILINEADSTSYDAYQQIRMRTARKVILDFNPSEPEGWIYDLLKEESTCLIRSTYLDNPFISDMEKRHFQNLKTVDQEYYRMFTLGERPSTSTKIYNHFKSFKSYPIKIDETSYGLDLGFNHPTALVRCDRSEDEYFLKEMIYESNLTTMDLIQRLNKIPNIKQHIIYTDSARPEVIEELKRSGFKATQAVKDVKPGIDFVRAHSVHVQEESLNIWNEYKRYSWKTVNGKQTDEPVKNWDDAMDAIRYAMYSSAKKQVLSKDNFRFF